MRGLRVEDQRPVVLRKNLRASSVDQQGGVPGRQETHRSRRVGIRSWRARKVEELFTVLIAKAPQRDLLHDGAKFRGRDSGPARDVADRCRPEGSQIAPDEVLESDRFGMRRGSNPAIRAGVEVRAALLPGSRRWNPNHVEPFGHPSPDRWWPVAGRQHRLQVGGTARLISQLLANRRSDALDIDVRQLFSRSSPPRFS